MDERLRKKLHQQTARAETAEALAEERRLEIVRLHEKLDELLRLAAAQNEQVCEMRLMLRRLTDKRGKRREIDEDPDDPKGPETPAPSGPAESDPTPPSPSASGPSPAPPKKERKPRPKGAG